MWYKFFAVLGAAWSVWGIFTESQQVLLIGLICLVFAAGCRIAYEMDEEHLRNMKSKGLVVPMPRKKRIYGE